LGVVLTTPRKTFLVTRPQKNCGERWRTNATDRGECKRIR